jgi:Tfp pilus assembly protein PilX
METFNRVLGKPSTIRSSRGSALLIALIFTVILAILAGSFLKLLTHERKMARHSLEGFSLLYLAEGGVERAIWAINNNNWTGWQSLNAGVDRYLARETVALGTRSSELHVLIQSADSKPLIYAEAISTLPSGQVLNRQIRVAYADGDQRPGGIITAGPMVFSGQPVIFSYDSSRGQPDLLFNHGDQVTIGSVSKKSDAMKLSGQVDIYGYAGTGKHKPEISGPHNKIKGADSPAGNIDWERVYLDFTYDFPPIVEPNWSGAQNSLPNAKKSAAVLGVAGGGVTKYKVKDFDLSGQSVVKVVGPVQMHLSDGMSISGQAYIQIEPGGSLEIYSPKDISISGQGIVNGTNRPKNLKIFGTVGKQKDQSLSLSGTGLLEGVVYAPNAVVSISGQGGFAGSLVGYDLKQSGQGGIYYDVTLGNADDDEKGITGWHDLVQSKHQYDFDTYVKSGGGKI